MTIRLLYPGFWGPAKQLQAHGTESMKAGQSESITSLYTLLKSLHFIFSKLIYNHRPTLFKQCFLSVSYSSPFIIIYEFSSLSFYLFLPSFLPIFPSYWSFTSSSIFTMRFSSYQVRAPTAKGQFLSYSFLFFCFYTHSIQKFYISDKNFSSHTV